MITPKDEAQIRQRCDQLLRDNAMPIIAITILATGDLLSDPLSCAENDVNELDDSLVRKD